MPPGANDRSQQGVGSGAGFPGSGLYPNTDIWSSRGSTNRGNASNSEGSPTNYAASTLNPNPEADLLWNLGPWNSAQAQRPVSTSPSRTRNELAHGHVPAPSSSLFDQAQPVRGRRPNGVFENSDAAAGYTNAFAARPRPEQSYMDALAGHNGSRDSSLASHSQLAGSTALPDRYRKGHTPSNSIHSSRAGAPIPNFAGHNGNSRSFNLNSQMENELSSRLRQAALDDGSGRPPSAASVNSQPFQFNPGSQPWNNGGDAAYRGMTQAMDGSQDNGGSYFGNLGSLSRHSPALNYRLDGQNNPRGYVPLPEAFGSRRGSRDQRPYGFDARDVLPQPQVTGRPNNLHLGGFDYSPYAPQYSLPGLSLNSPYQQTMIPAYELHSGLAGGIPAFLNAASLNPAAVPRREQDPARGLRSALLEEFRHSNKSSRKHDLKDIYNHVVEFSGDQHGSRFIQQKLETANSDEKDQVFQEIEPNAIQLMKDVFGNYVVQKFFEHGSQVQKRVLAEKMKGKVVDLSVQVYACRVVQKAMEHVLVEQQAELTEELKPEIIRVIKDQNGNHVVQKIIELVPREYLGFIMDNLRGQVQTLATHTYGCRVIQRVLEYGSEEDKAEVMRELHSSVQMLITDQFGNYVAQHVIVNGKPEDSQRFIGLVLDNFIAFSKHKFASNVVEKCIECATPEQRTQVREMLKASTADGTSNLQHMIRDQFGNYVIQKLVAGLQGEERDCFVEEIKPQFFQLKKTNGNSKQLQAMEKLLGASGQGPASPPGRNERGSTNSGEGSSKSPTPNLTNNTNSPQSSSPQSTHVSAVQVQSEPVAKAQSSIALEGTALQVNEAEVV